MRLLDTGAWTPIHLTNSADPPVTRGRLSTTALPVGVSSTKRNSEAVEGEDLRWMRFLRLHVGVNAPERQCKFRVCILAALVYPTHGEHQETMSN